MSQIIDKVKVVLNYYLPLATQRLRMLPNFIIPGAQKCGTTSLYLDLKQHPEIRLSRSKEVWYFDRDYHKGLPWYRSNFPLWSAQKLSIGDVTPSYLDHPKSAERIKALIPNCRLIFILRDPVERAYSHYFHSRRLGVEPIESFEEAVELESKRLGNVCNELESGRLDYSCEYTYWGYLSKGHYYKNLQKYFAIFNHDQILVLWSNEYDKNPELILNRIAEHLEIRSWNWDVKGKANVGDNKLPLPSKAYDGLLGCFEESDRKLGELINKKIPWRN